MPDLHLIAAGSLLEFALKELPSFGVGRVRSIFMYPFSFDEFLHALGEDLILEAKKKACYENPLTELIHTKLIKLLKQYLIIGGMPEVISKYITNKNILECQKVLDDIVSSLRADFAKYKKRIPSLRILEVFESVIKQMGGKFVYSKTISQSNNKQIKEALDLLIMAGLVIPVTHSSSNGIPLGAESNIKKRKMLIYDTGIFQRILGLNISEILLENEFDVINKGAIAELFVGLEMLKSYSCYQQHELYYWQRETASGNAEVDYVIQYQNKVLPIEVKSGSKGSMQSIYVFLNEKQLEGGIRFSLENYLIYNNIKVIPLYGVAELISTIR